MGEREGARGGMAGMAACVERRTASLRVDLPPCYAQKAVEGVGVQLDQRLMRWGQDVEGVLLAYDQLQLQSQKGSIHPVHAYVRVKANARTLLFRPEIGRRVRGTVTRVGRASVNLTVLGAFHATIKAAELGTHHRHDPQIHAFVHETRPERNLEVGKDVEFVIKNVHVRHGKCSLEGSLAKLRQERKRKGPAKEEEPVRKEASQRPQSQGEGVEKSKHAHSKAKKEKEKDTEQQKHKATAEQKRRRSETRGEGEETKHSPKEDRKHKKRRKSEGKG